MNRRAGLAARQLAMLFALGAALAFVAAAARGDERLPAVLVGCASMSGAALAVAIPWTRWRRTSDLLLLFPAVVLLGVAASARLLPPRSYGALFILLFAWVGAHRRPATGLWLLPAATVAYSLPLLLTPPDVPFSPSGCLVTMSVCGVVAEVLSRTIASRAAAERARADAAQMLRLILDRSPQATVAIDANGVCTLANSNALAISGCTVDELVGRRMHEVMHHTLPDGTAYAAENCPIRTAMAEGRSVHVDGEIFWRKDGSSYDVDYRAEPILRDGVTVGAVVTFEDITHRRRAEATAQALLRDSERRAHTDVLTGIGNRRHAAGFLATIAAGDVLALLDVDHFKRVNDEQGHAAGDAVLRDLAQHLGAELRSGDDVARYGGEEFLVMLVGAADIGHTVVQRIAYSWQQDPARPTFSAGVVVHRDGMTPEQTIALADRALYRAKRSGRNCVVSGSETGYYASAAG
jgi:diguanylate cyclase (GGDEF)-like protein/PAS domain S-box-containing protein